MADSQTAPQPNEGGITVTIRLIRSFEYRTFRNLVLTHIDPSVTVGDLKKMIADKLKTAPGILPPFRTFTYDTLKLYTKAHGMKTVNLIINMENDEECIFNDDGKTLAELGVENETEISYFKLEDYIKYKEHPDNKW